MTSGPDIHENIRTIEAMIRDAAAQGARFILTPENSDRLGVPVAEKVAQAPVFEFHPMLVRAADLARELGVWLSIGSVAIRDEAAGDKIRNRSCLYGPDGILVAFYDKIHLFDAVLPSGEAYRESDMAVAGSRIALADMEGACVGMSICYDVRFPHLFRAMAGKGVRIFLVPAAFTVPTGEAHWEVLLRARAIENGAFVLAAAQCGDHGNGRKTYGHSMVVDPWGRVLAEAGDAPGLVIADIDLSECDRFAASIGSLSHDRPFS